MTARITLQVKLNHFLSDISEHVNRHDLDKLKGLMKGLDGFREAALCEIDKPDKFFEKLKNMCLIEPGNVVVLQALVLLTGNQKLYDTILKKVDDDFIHITMPVQDVQRGCGFKLFHFKGKALKTDQVNELHSFKTNCERVLGDSIRVLEEEGVWWVILRTQMCGELELAEPPPDSGLKHLLRRVTDEMTNDELKWMKFYIKDQQVISLNELDKCDSFIDLWLLLERCGFLDVNNVIYLQALLNYVKRKDLLTEVEQYAIKHKSTLHFGPPEAPPANGLKYVRFHLKGGDVQSSVESIQSADTDENERRELKFRLEALRKKVAEWFDIEPCLVAIAGIQETGSWTVTLMIPESCFAKLSDLAKRNKSWFTDQRIDFMRVDGKIYDLEDKEPEAGGSCDLQDNQNKGDGIISDKGPNVGLPVGKSYHLFFIYSSADEEYVQRTVKVLESPKYRLKCYNHHRDAIIGQPKLDHLLLSMSQSITAVVVLTSDFLIDQLWVHLEQFVCMLNAQGELQLVPIVHKPCQIPNHLKMFVRIDETKGDVAEDKIFHAVCAKGKELETGNYSYVVDKQDKRGSISDKGPKVLSGEEVRLPDGKSHHLLFIYSPADHEYVQKTVAVLESSKYRLKCCFLIGGGISRGYVDEFQIVSESMTAVLVITSDFLTDSWCNFYEQRLLVLKVEGSLEQIISLIHVHNPCEIPGHLKLLTCIYETNGEVTEDKIFQAVSSAANGTAPKEAIVDEGRIITKGPLAPYIMLKKKKPKQTIFSMPIEKDEDEYDLFIAHCENDDKFVRETLNILESSPYNLRCCLSLRDFTPGMTIVDNIWEFMLKSNNVLLMSSSADRDKTWFTYEEEVAHYLSDSGKLGIILIKNESSTETDITNGRIFEEIFKAIKILNETSETSDETHSFLSRATQLVSWFGAFVRAIRQRILRQ